LSQRHQLPDLDRTDYVLALAVGVGGLAVYARTLAPDVLYSDSAEFQTLAYTLGMTHSTGYPVYLPLARLLGYLPLGTFAWRVNLLSAVSAAITLSAVFFACASRDAESDWRAARGGCIGSLLHVLVSGCDSQSVYTGTGVLERFRAFAVALANRPCGAKPCVAGRHIAVWRGSGCSRFCGDDSPQALRGFAMGGVAARRGDLATRTATRERHADYELAGGLYSRFYVAHV
jgi:hypothetical protein